MVIQKCIGSVCVCVCVCVCVWSRNQNVLTLIGLCQSLVLHEAKCNGGYSCVTICFSRLHTTWMSFRLSISGPPATTSLPGCMPSGWWRWCGRSLSHVAFRKCSRNSISLLAVFASWKTTGKRDTFPELQCGSYGHRIQGRILGHICNQLIVPMSIVRQ